MEWDRINSANLYMLTWSDIYLTTNFGATWTTLTGNGGYPAPLLPNTQAVIAGQQHPFAQLLLNGSTRVVLAALPCEGLYYSYDGTSFTNVYPFPGGSANPDNCIRSIAADDPTGYVYFSTVADPGSGNPPHVFASTCAWTTTTPCLSWTSASSGLPTNNVPVISLVDTADYGGGLTFPQNLAALVPTTPGSGASIV